MNKYWYSTTNHGDESGFDCYRASEADARIADLERLLDVELRSSAAANELTSAALRWEAEAERLGKRVEELEKALRGVMSALEDSGPLVVSKQLHDEFEAAQSVL